ncbi:MAG: hypothetical protein GQ539_17795 [Sulfitobacter sp.]|nr:hypothetical protein [Sulfitobacter sp.]
MPRRGCRPLLSKRRAHNRDLSLWRAPARPSLNRLRCGLTVLALHLNSCVRLMAA